MITVNLPNEFLFFISMEDPWYGGIFLYLRTQNFKAHLSREDRRHIQHQFDCHLLIGDVLYYWGIDTILRRCLTHNEAGQVLNEYHSGACDGHLSGLETS